MICFLSVKCDFIEGSFCFYEMRLRRCHSCFKDMTCSRHSFVLICLCLIFFIVWVLLIFGIGKAIVKINHHYLWLKILSSLCKPISQCVPQDTHTAFRGMPSHLSTHRLQGQAPPPSQGLC